MEHCKEVVFKRTADRFSGLDLAPVAILQTGNTFQEEKQTLYTKTAIKVIRHQLKLAELKQVLFRCSVLDTGLQNGVRSSHHIWPPETPYRRQIYKLVRSEVDKSSNSNAIWNEVVENEIFRF